LISDYAARTGYRIEGMTPDAMQALLAHSWPGNIRELRNVIERAVVLCPGPVISLDDLPDHFHLLGSLAGATSTPTPAGPGSSLEPPIIPFVSAPARSTLAESKDQTERTQITQALERNDFNRQRAAAELGISRMTLYKKLHKYGLMGA
jgi:DNA-binding NtrC family response regulator